MKLLPQNRWRIALAAAAIVLAFIVSIAATPRQSVTQEVVQPAPQLKRQKAEVTAEAEPLAPLPLKEITRPEAPKTTRELFKPKSWYVPPPPPPPAPPPPPTAPPLPFVFLGKVANPDGTVTIFLSGHDHVYLVKGGETIDGMYSVDGVDNGQITLTYLPLKIKQFLTVGDSP